MNIWMLVGLTAFQGVVVAFNQPARLALVPSLVTQSDLASAVAINSVIFNLGALRRPMLAGLAIVWSGVSAAFAVNALSYVAFLMALTRVHDRFRPTSRRPNARSSRPTCATASATRRPIPAIAALLAAPDRDRHRRPAAQRTAAGICRRGFRGRRRALAARLGDRRRRDRRRVVARPPREFGGPDPRGDRRLGRRRGRGRGGRRHRPLWLAIPGIMAYGFCGPSAGIAIQTLVQLALGARDARTVIGLYGLDFPRRARDRGTGGGRRIDLVRVALAGRARLGPCWSWQPAPGPGAIARGSKPPCRARSRTLRG